jgi:hypothetical protein
MRPDLQLAKDLLYNQKPVWSGTGFQWPLMPGQTAKSVTTAAGAHVNIPLLDFGR